MLRWEAARQRDGDWASVMNNGWSAVARFLEEAKKGLKQKIGGNAHFPFALGASKAAAALDYHFLYNYAILKFWN